MVNCPNCGNANKSNFIFCQFCGSKLMTNGTSSTSNKVGNTSSNVSSTEKAPWQHVKYYTDEERIPRKASDFSGWYTFLFIVPKILALFIVPIVIYNNVYDEFEAFLAIIGFIILTALLIFSDLLIAFLIETVGELYKNTAITAKCQMMTYNLLASNIEKLGSLNTTDNGIVGSNSTGMSVNVDELPSL